MKYVQFSDETETLIVSVFGGPQDPDVFDHLGEVEDDDPRYLAFINPREQPSVVNPAKLAEYSALAEDQKSKLSIRIGVIQDAIDLDMETPEEVAELPIRKAQLVEWKKYAVYLGRVSQQEGWAETVVWSVQPEIAIP